MPDCLFCRIVAGEIPSDQVASSENTIAFRDINPQASTHVQIIPKHHIENAHVLTPADAATLAEMITTAQQVAEAEGVAGNGYRLVFNVGPDSGNTVPHLHLHLIGGRRLGWPPG